MKKGFYAKLAWEGIRKNQRLYLPYILTCIGMVMMHYIVSFLSVSPVLAGLSGGDSIAITLNLGSWVLALFSVVFLFYTNAFLIRRRKKEFGLYNILGMGKRNISKILFWETIIITGISLGVGLALGIILSKLFELGLVNIMLGSAGLAFNISGASILKTVEIFLIVFILLFLNSLRQISLSNSVSLLRSENVGEKPPKANWLLAVAGVVILGIAYHTAVVIKDPLSALNTFFIAVLMVIIATYLLFIAGSVVLCKLLQKNRSYYYKANHFVSVSSMTYRMKRNGAGLASICILLTAVLVMLSSTTALFVGVEDSLRSRYPRNIMMNVRLTGPEQLNAECIGELRQQLDSMLGKYEYESLNQQEYGTAWLAGWMKDGEFVWDASEIEEINLTTYSDLVQLYFVSLEDYNRIENTDVTLEPDEVLICSYRTDYEADYFKISDEKQYKIKEELKKLPGNGNTAMSIVPTVFVIGQDLPEMVASLAQQKDANGNGILQIYWYYGFDLDIPAEKEIAFFYELKERSNSIGAANQGIISGIDMECMELERSGFYGIYGGLFYLGIILSIVFLAAAVLIIYYKQISEGYEDQGRFEIMKKVGMTKKDIRKSINSQMLTVFFLPLVFAGIHLCFAFPMIEKLIQLFNLWNTKLLVITTLICFLVFALFYGLVYRVTSNAYFSIVSGAKKE